jgi:hypothetical protein
VVLVQREDRYIIYVAMGVDCACLMMRLFFVRETSHSFQKESNTCLAVYPENTYVELTKSIFFDAVCRFRYVLRSADER